MLYKRFTYLMIFCFALAAPAAAMAEPAFNPTLDTRSLVSSMADSAIMRIDPDDQKQKSILPSEIDFAELREFGFLDTRRHLIKAVDESRTGLSSSAKTTDALLRLAEFYLSYGMVLEAKSILPAFDPAMLSAEHNARKAAVSIALNVLDPWNMVVTDADIETLESPDNWPNHALFRAIYFIRKADLERADPYLAAAVDNLAKVTPSIKEVVLPRLLQAAIKTRNWVAAKEFAVLFTKNNHLKDGTAYQYLLGQVTESGGDYLTAFDNYVMASEGTDQWAHLARLSLVELGIKTKILGPQDARDMLEEIRFIWRGDALALRTLNLLIETELALKNEAAALEVLGEIIYSNLDEASTLKAKEQAGSLLKAFYGEGAAGRVGLSKFMQAHQQIAPDYRFQKGFGEYSEQFADRLLAVGVSDEAAREYETTYNYLSVAQDLGLFEIHPDKLDQLRLKQVKALLRGGQYDAAMPVLAYGAQGPNLEIRDAFTILKVELFNITGDTKAILAENVQNPTEGYLRIKAKAYFSLADWKNAKKTYNQLWQQQDEQFQFTDALNMLLSAYHEKDVDLALKLIELFPDLTDAPQWHEIATGLFSNKNLDEILRKDVISSDISNAERVLDVMEIINTSSQ